jgi:dienelactone hydrolase
MMKSFFKIAAAVLVVVAVGSFIAGWYFYTRDYGSYFAKRHGKLAHVDLRLTGGDTLTERSWVTLENEDGFTVDCGMLTPKEKGRRFPAIVLLGGKATGKYAVNYALGIRDVIVVAPDYPYDPRDSYTLIEFLSDVPEIRKALLDMVPAVMLVTDYLWQRNDVDTTKMVLLGYSFGAPFVPCIISHDRRAAVAAMVYGGGELRSLIRHNVRRYEGPLMSEFVGLLGGLLLRPLEPLRYVNEVAPTPLIMINGADDEQIPRQNAERVYDKAREPKRIIWLESRHVDVSDAELTKLIVTTLTEELSRLKILELPHTR